MKIFGIGDSNMVINGGWGEAFDLNNDYEGYLEFPGGSTRDALKVLPNKNLRHANMVVISFGINDYLKDVGVFEFVRNYVKITRHVRFWSLDRPKIIWMPSHPTGSLKLEVMRFALWVYSQLVGGVTFVNLRDYRGTILFNDNGDDRYHLIDASYRVTAARILQDIKWM